MVAFSLGSRIHVHLLLLPLHLLRLAQRNAIFPYTCKNKASFLRTCRLLEAISIVSVHQSLFGQVRKYDLDLSSLARDPFLSSPLGITKTRGIRGGNRTLPIFFQSILSHLERKESASRTHFQTLKKPIRCNSYKKGKILSLFQNYNYAMHPFIQQIFVEQQCPRN